MKFKGINGKIKSTLQSTWIAEFDDTLRGFADLENNTRIVDHESLIGLGQYFVFRRFFEQKISDFIKSTVYLLVVSRPSDTCITRPD